MLERAACCLQVGKFVGMISFYCESGAGYSCSLITLICFCLERKGGGVIHLYGIFIKVNQIRPRKSVWGIIFLDLKRSI